MRLDQITPVILTRDEGPNISRSLTKLSWAHDVVVVDSGSSDITCEIARGCPNVRLFVHEFDNHAAQWTFATTQTGITTEWLLILDADLMVSDSFVQELSELEPDSKTSGYVASFRYRVHGHVLPRSIYPPRIVLCRRKHVAFIQEGHTQRLSVTGKVRSLKNAIDHDDRKSLTHWIRSQDAYARLERAKLLSASQAPLRLSDRIRALRFIAPIAVCVYCLFGKKLIFAGLPGWYYTYQRVMAEVLLSLYLIEDRLAEREQPGK